MTTLITTNTLKNKKIIFITIGIFAVLILGYLVFMSQRPLAIVGDIEISKTDADYRDQIILLDVPDEKRSLGLYQLMKTAYSEEILKNNSYIIQPSQILTEEERINKATKDPEKLKKIKNIFKNDVDAYRRVFIKPALIDKVIYYEFFTKDEKIHAESLKQTMDFIKGYDPKVKFSDYANSLKIKYQNLNVSLKKGLTWQQPSGLANTEPIRLDNLSEKSNKNNKKMGHHQPGLPMPIQGQQNLDVLNRLRPQFENTSAEKNEEAKKWIDSILDKALVSQVLGVPLNRDDAWLVIYLVAKKSNSEYDLLVATFPKINYSDWLITEKKKIPVTVHNKKLLVP